MSKVQSQPTSTSTPPPTKTQVKPTATQTPYSNATQTIASTNSKDTAPPPNALTNPFSISSSENNLSEIKFEQPNISQEDRNRWDSNKNTVKWNAERSSYILKNGKINLDPIKGTFNPNINLNQGLANAMVQTTKAIPTGEGRCYEAVGIALEKVMSKVIGSNFTIPGAFSPHAAHFAELMRSNTPEGSKLKEFFKEMPVPSNASQIPKGSICVWNRGSKGYSAKAGHISVWDGNKQHFGTTPQDITNDRLPDFIFVPTGNNSRSVQT